MRNAVWRYAIVISVFVVASLTMASAATIELNVSYTDANLLKSVHEEIAKRFESEHPDIKIKLTDVGATDDSLRSALRDAATGQLPDVMYHAMNHLTLLAERDLPVSMNGFIGAEKNWAASGYTDAVESMGSVRGQVYGIPFSIAMPFVFYNADIVRQAGVQPADFPTTWTGIVALAKKLKAPSGGIFFDYEASGNWTFIALVQSLGGEMMKPDGKTIAFDGPAGMRALQILREIGQAGAVNMSRDQARQAFAAGSLGILITSSSGLGNYEKAAKGHFDLRTAAFPIEASNGKVPAAGFAAVIYSKDPIRQKAAWEYIKFATNPESQTLMVRDTGYVPVNAIAIERADLLGNFYQEHPNHLPAVHMLPAMTAWFTFPGENSLKINDVIRDYLQRVVTLRQSPEEVMPKMSQDAAKLLPR
jgi:multiple sugar transport system substrate-binding protein